MSLHALLNRSSGVNGNQPINVDFTTFATGDMSAATFTSLTGLRFTRASDGYTVQTSDVTLSAGLTGNDRPRIAQRTATSAGRGLAIQEARTNTWPVARGLGAGTGIYPGMAPAQTGSFTVTSDSTVGPAGEATPNRAILVHCPINEYGRSYYDPTVNLAGTFSFWVKSNGANTYQGLAGYKTFGGSSNINAHGGNTANVWSRVILQRVFGTDYLDVVPCDGRDWSTYGGVVNGARDCSLDYIQLECVADSGTDVTLGFATDVITTTSVALTRAGEHLDTLYGPAQVVAGRLDLTITFRALSPRAGSYFNPAYIWYNPANGDGAWIAESNSGDAGFIKISIGGTVRTFNSGVTTWTTGDIVELYVGQGAGSSRAAQRINGAAVTGFTTLATLGAFAIAAQMDILCAGTANQLTVDVQKIRVNDIPAWVPP